jgi:hypothetical protein
MTDKDAMAMAMALEALESCTPQDTSTGHVIHAWHDEELVNGAITALKEALAQRTEQEPVAWMHTKIDGVAVPHRPSDLDKHPERWEALYKTPPQRTWVGLTDEQIKTIDEMALTKNMAIAMTMATLKEKNT